MEQTRRLTGKYQTPFGIAVWGFTEPGEAQEILVDDEGHLQVVTIDGSLTDVNLVEYGGVVVDPDNPLDVQTIVAGAAIDPRNRNWNLGATDIPDLSDRWARQLGLIDVSRVLGAALTAANPLIMGVFDAAGNRMPSMDVAARPGFVDMIDRAARLVGVISGTVDITELPAAAALSDTFANPTTTQIGSFLMGWENGASQWERVAIDANGRLEIVSV